MCVVIDSCCIVKVFDPQNREHSNYAPVLEWVSEGDGRIVYGGSKYRTELQRAARYLGVITELHRRGRAVHMPDGEVDALATRLRQKVGSPSFNDEHLVALTIVSKCCVVCTGDNTAISYLKNRQLYAGHKVKRPKIYTSKRNERLCCTGNTRENYG